MLCRFEREHVFFLLLWSTYMKRFDFFNFFFFFARHRMQAAAYFFFGSLWASDILGLEERAIFVFALKSTRVKNNTCLSH